MSLGIHHSITALCFYHSPPPLITVSLVRTIRCSGNTHARIAVCGLACDPLSPVDHYADLRKANLTEVSLGKADLKGANLSGANLTKANLDGAVLCHTTMPDGKENNSGCTQN